jgi:hypothetical protein
MYQDGQYQFVKQEATVQKYKWTESCPNKDCRGFLNDLFFCCACNEQYCKDCLIHLSSKEEEHTCDENLKATIKMIRKESKPCPHCHEMISKIDGCDQMFCTQCGTAFSWKTGQVERGTIHNPHAHQFFQQNPNALRMYQQNRGGQPQNQQEECRSLYPRILRFENLSQEMKSILHTKEAYMWANMNECHRYIAEFEQYRKRRIEHEIREVNDPNIHRDLRIRYLRKEVDETHMKSILHARYKKLSFRRQIHNIIVPTNMIIGGILWSILEIRTIEELKVLYQMLLELRESTNQILLQISKQHNYKQLIEYKKNFQIVDY